MCAPLFSNAANTQAVLSLTATVSTSCAAAFSIPNMNITGVAIPPQYTNLTLTCTGGTSIAGMTTQSSQGWALTNAVSGDSIAYNLSSATPTGATVDMSSNWTGSPGQVTVVSILTSPFVIDDLGTPVTFPLTVALSTPGASVNAGDYTDTMTATINF